MSAPPEADADARFMRRALELAETGWGRVHPNPLVGAVVVRDGEVVGEGAHREFGGPHAEVEALRAAGERARGATLYVTLEPCAHHGKTPPCTDAVLEYGVSRLVYAVADPDPRARGGAERLRDRGLTVEGGVEEERASRQNALFLRPLETGGSFVTLKFGLTLDARIAARAGERTAITGPETRAEVHRLRAGYDAIVVGGRTARVDDPLLTVRDAPAPRIPPTRVVADQAARLPLDSRLVETVAEAPTWALVGPSAPAERLEALGAAGVELLSVPGTPRGLDLDAALEALRDRGVRTVFCEGGGRLGAALLAAGLVDRLHLFYAPRVLGDDGVPAFPGGVFEGAVTERRAVGPDTLLTLDRS